MGRVRKSKVARMVERQNGAQSDAARSRKKLVEAPLSEARGLDYLSKTARSALCQGRPEKVRELAAGSLDFHLYGIDLARRKLRDGWRTVNEAAAAGKERQASQLSAALVVLEESRADSLEWLKLLETRCAADLMIEMLGDNPRPACAEIVQPDDELMALAAEHLEAAAGDPVAAGRTLGIALRDREWIGPDDGDFYGGLAQLVDEEAS